MEELTPVLYEIVSAGGFTTGGFNFDTKLRRQSLDRTDLFHGHIGGMDTFARSLIIADDIIKKSPIEKMRRERYSSFDGGKGAEFEAGKLSLVQLAELGNKGGEPPLKSGQQELYENIVNRYVR